jgi:raffinose/stachyose/melibiose transport system permease protein
MKKDGEFLKKAVLYLFLTILLIIYLFPLYYILNTSLKTQQDFLANPNGITRTFAFSNFVFAWQHANFGTYIINSILYTGICTAVNIVMAILLAFPIARKHLKKAGLITTLFVSTMFLPDGTIPRFQMFLGMHAYNSRLGYMLWMTGVSGVALFFFVSFIRGIPKDFDEAAAIDGCGYMKYVLNMIIPMMKPAIASMAILNAINIWNDLIGATVVIRNDKLLPITRGLMNFSGSYSVNWTELTAAMLIVAFPLITIYIFTQRFIIESVVASGLKG